MIGAIKEVYYKNLNEMLEHYNKVRNKKRLLIKQRSITVDINTYISLQKILDLYFLEYKDSVVVFKENNVESFYMSDSFYINLN